MSRCFLFEINKKDKRVTRSDEFQALTPVKKYGGMRQQQIMFNYVSAGGIRINEKLLLG